MNIVLSHGSAVNPHSPSLHEKRMNVSILSACQVFGGCKRKIVSIFRQRFCEKPAALCVSMSLRDEKRVQQRLPRFSESHLHSAEGFSQKRCLNILLLDKRLRNSFSRSVVCAIWIIQKRVLWSRLLRLSNAYGRSIIESNDCFQKEDCIWILSDNAPPIWTG